MVMSAWLFNFFMFGMEGGKCMGIRVKGGSAVCQECDGYGK